MYVGESVVGSPPAEVCLVVSGEFGESGGFDDAQQIADKFRRGVPVIANLQGCEAPIAVRLIDFISGLTYALGGSLEILGERVFLLAPPNVEVSSDVSDGVLGKGFVNQV
jgi:cell division inhibitor SepF